MVVVCVKHQLITPAEYTSNLLVRGTSGCAVLVRVSPSPSGRCVIQCGSTPSMCGGPVHVWGTQDTVSLVLSFVNEATPSHR